MGTRDLLLLIGFLRSGKMFPTALSFKALSVQRSLKLVLDGMGSRSGRSSAARCVPAAAAMISGAAPR